MDDVDLEESKEVQEFGFEVASNSSPSAYPGENVVDSVRQTSEVGNLDSQRSLSQVMMEGELSYARDQPHRGQLIQLSKAGMASHQMGSQLVGSSLANAIQIDTTHKDDKENLSSSLQGESDAAPKSFDSDKSAATAVAASARTLVLRDSTNLDQNAQPKAASKQQ